MKKNLIFVFYFLLLRFSVSAGGGIYETYMSFSLNGGGEFYHGTGGGNPSLQGAVLGINLDLNTATLVMKLRGINSWNDGGCDVTSANMNYRVYKNGDPAPSFTSLPLNLNGSSGNNKFWNDNSPDINLLAGLTSIGTYNFEVYFDAPTNASGGCDPVLYASNGGLNYIASFSVSTALPVKFSSFIVKNENENNLVYWSTSSELNNDYFEVQYSEDGKTFDAIGKVHGTGNIGKTMQYEFIHEKPVRGLSYYRLKQVDLDGKFEYSSVLTSYIDYEDILIYPNPATEKLNFAGIADHPIDVTITDFAGKEVFSIKGFLDHYLEISALISGMYTICVSENRQTSCQKFVKY